MVQPRASYHNSTSRPYLPRGGVLFQRMRSGAAVELEGPGKNRQPMYRHRCVLPHLH